MPSNTSRLSFALILGSLLAAGLSTIAITAGPKFFADDPVWVEADTQDASGMTLVEPDLFVDVAYNSIGSPGDPARVRAKNVNTVDEVPDSSWFTNRLGRRTLTADEVMRGPDTTPGPASGQWTITASKSDGVTPGFTIRDSNRQLWFLKFDPPGYRAMATGTEVLVTKLLWALGYNVPENYIAYLRSEQLTVGDGARYTPPGGKRRPMRSSDIAALLKRADRETNGSYRVVASKAIEGKPIGRIRFYGTRPDDPNDLVPHEHRRELRGYGVFAAWLNHSDAKAINSFDSLVQSDRRSFVRHYLLDFGSALGSGGIGPKEYWEGYESVLEGREVVRQMIGFGFRPPLWRTTPFYEARSIGRLPRDNTRFNPELWKPRVPNQAFLHARADDKFWAASKLMTLTDEMIRAAVRAGQFDDSAAEAFLVKALGERRDSITRAYLAAINPIVDPSLDPTGSLVFRNAAVDRGVEAAPGGYKAAWFIFDNASHESRAMGETSGSAARLQAPPAVAAGSHAYIKVQLSATGATRSSWGKPVDAYFRRGATGWSLVGFERLPDER